MKTVAAYKLINSETNEILDIALSFESLAEKYLCSKRPELHVIKAYPLYDVTTLEELKDRIDGSDSYIRFSYEPAGKDTSVFDMIGSPAVVEHYAIAKIDILG